MSRIFVLAVVLACQSASAQDESLEYGMSDAQRVQVNGTTLTYVEKGTGVPLLLVHGAFADFRYWQPVIDSLAEAYRVIGYSRRDFHPNPLDNPPTANPYADRDDLAALIERLDLAPVHLVGHSGGGHVALALAAARPDLLRSVTTVEGGFLDAGVSEQALAGLASFGPVIQIAREHFVAGNDEAGVQKFLEHALGRDAYQRWSESDKKRALQNAHTFGRRPEAGLSCADVASIRTPALLLIGAVTPPANRAMMQGVQECVPGIETVEIERASHNIHVDNAHGFSVALLDFEGRH
jgi:pimeloyl-ACP methyl ester carboxylesterase